MKNLVIVALLAVSLTGCEVTNSTFGTPGSSQSSMGLAEQQAVVSVGQVGVNYYQQKINEQVLANQRLEQENRVLRSRSMQTPVVARSVETKAVAVLPPKRVYTSPPKVVIEREEDGKGYKAPDPKPVLKPKVSAVKKIEEKIETEKKEEVVKLDEPVKETKIEVKETEIKDTVPIPEEKNVEPEIPVPQE